MSLLRNITANPSVVTIFHTSKKPLSCALLKQLKLQSHSQKPSFHLQVSDKRPSYEEAHLIFQTLLHDKQYKKLKEVYPWVMLDDVKRTPFVTEEQYSTLSRVISKPLVVEWDDGHIATDEEGLTNLLKDFEK